MNYLEIQCHLQFEKEITWFGYPETILRSVLGANLHRMCCIVKNQSKCSDCVLKDNCVYSWIFESHINKDSLSLTGRDKAPHPFILEYDQINPCEGIINITLLGKSMYFSPFIINAFIKAGENGIGKERIKYTITSLTSDSVEFFGNRTEIEAHTKKWDINEDNSDSRKIVGIELLTPCRIKSNGKYINRILIQDVLKSILRRVITLEELYGQPIKINTLDNFPYSIERDQRWVERRYVSSRTSTVMSLGGVVGKIHFSGALTNEQKNLLRAGELFHIGKNVAFGLGRIKLLYGEENDD